MKIERDKVYLTRCGEKVRVVCVDGNCPGFPVVGLNDAGMTIAYTVSGEFDLDYSSSCDLVSEYVEPPKRREVWVSPSEVTLNWAAYPAEGLRCLDPRFVAKLVKFREVIE